MKALSKIPEAIGTLVTLRKATRGTQVSAGVGVVLTGALTYGVVAGYVEASDAADLFEYVAIAVSALTGVFEYFAKRRAEKDGEEVQDIINPALAPSERLKVDGRLGPVSKAAVQAVTNSSPGHVRPAPVEKRKWGHSSGNIKPTQDAPPPPRKPAPPKLHGGRGR